MRGVHWWWRATGRKDISKQVRNACITHDKAYWEGGSAWQRTIADANLSRDISSLNYPFLARLIFIGVSIGGHPLLPFPWRWGYGWKYPRGYSK
jgi:hypothetical protein